MMTEIVRIDPDRPASGAIRRAAECLRHGGLVAFPTETVYGLGAHALDRDAVRRVFAAKRRPASDPLIVHLATAEHADALAVSVPAVARRLAARFWPGPLTLVLHRSPAVPDEVTAGLPTVAVRIPAHPVARALLDAVRLPVAAPSANLFSRPSPTTAAHVLEDLDGRIDMILDAGPTIAGIESTVVDLTCDPPALLRPGVVSLEELREVVSDLRLHTGTPASVPALPSPGLLPRHYAPRAPMTLYEGDPAAARRAMAAGAIDALAKGHRVGVMATTEQATLLAGLHLTIADLGSEQDLRAVAARLYAALRDLDAKGVDVILAADFAHHEGLARALRDRLRRAAVRIVTAATP